MLRIISIYAALYFALTFGDAFSTMFAQSGGVGGEFNPHAQNGEGLFHLSKFWLMNIIAFMILSPMLYWGVSHRQGISVKYLRQPLLAAYKVFYLNPFAKHVRSLSAFHFIAVAVTMLLVKAFATISNINAGINQVSFADGLVVFFRQFFDGHLLYWAVMTSIILPFWLIALYVSAFFLKRDSKNEFAVVSA